MVIIFEEKFESFPREYYRFELDNSEPLIDCFEHFNNPNGSPTTNLMNNMGKLSNFILLDKENTNSDNLLNFSKGAFIQFEDNFLFQLDNTFVSRGDVFWNQNN